MKNRIFLFMFLLFFTFSFTGCITMLELLSLGVEIGANVATDIALEPNKSGINEYQVYVHYKKTPQDEYSTFTTYDVKAESKSEAEYEGMKRFRVQYPNYEITRTSVIRTK